MVIVTMRRVDMRSAFYIGEDDGAPVRCPGVPRGVGVSFVSRLTKSLPMDCFAVNRDTRRVARLRPHLQVDLMSTEIPQHPGLPSQDCITSELYVSQHQYLLLLSSKNVAVGVESTFRSPQLPASTSPARL